GREPIFVESFQIALQELIFAAIEEFAVGSFGGEFAVVEGQAQRVVERHPTEARRLEARAHGFAIRKFGLDAKTVEYPCRIIISLLFLDARLRGEKLPDMRGGHVVIFVAEEGFPRRDELRIFRTAGDRRVGGLERSAGKRVIFIVRDAVCRQSGRMGMVINGADAANSGEERGIGFLRGGEWHDEKQKDEKS